ncbi:MAG: DUF177 domain-containing protein [Oscillospiraceae bacterium]|nr:DUF177 domain-containing protein [Oscillospiraceae bacterium]
MLMNVKNLLNVPGTSEEIRFCVSEERLAEVHDYVFATPVEVTGKIANHAGVVTLTMRITFSLLVTCDRCLKETVQAFDYQEAHTVVRMLESEENEEDYVLARAESIDPEEIAVTDLLLALPTKMLCREDCKGLCPVCGCDRNETDCGCMG